MGVLHHELCLVKIMHITGTKVIDRERNKVELIMIKVTVNMLEKWLVVTKLFGQKKALTVLLIMERIYNIDTELKIFIEFDTNC